MAQTLDQNHNHLFSSVLFIYLTLYNLGQIQLNKQELKSECGYGFQHAGFQTVFYS